MPEGSITQDSPVPREEGIPQWEKPVRYMAAAFLAVGVLLLLLFLVPVLQMVLLGFIISFLMYPPISRIVRRTGLRHPLTVVLFYLLLIIFLVVILITLGSFLIEGSQGLWAAVQAARPSLEIPDNSVLRQTVQAAPQFLGDVIKALLSVFTDIAGLIGLVGAAVLFSFFLLMDLNKAQGTLADWVPPRFRREIGLLLARLDHIWVGYLLAQLIYATALAGLSLVQYYLMGVPFPALMAVLTGIISLIPSVGGLIASVVVSIPCLILGSTAFVDMSNTTFALLVLLVNVVITQFSYNFIALPIVGRYVKLPVSLVFVAVLVGLGFGSPVLAFLVVPILSTLRVAGSYILSKAMGREPFPEETLPESPQAGFFSQLYVVSPVSEP
jgi:predicted PurR-regulated permease PerM